VAYWWGGWVGWFCCLCYIVIGRGFGWVVMFGLLGTVGWVFGFLGLWLVLCCGYWVFGCFVVVVEFCCLGICVWFFWYAMSLVMWLWLVVWCFSWVLCFVVLWFFGVDCFFLWFGWFLCVFVGDFVLLVVGFGYGVFGGVG